MYVYIGSNGLANIIAADMCVGLGSVDNATMEPWLLIFRIKGYCAGRVTKVTSCLTTQIVGSLAIILSAFCFFLLPSSPAYARFLIKDEKVTTVRRIAQNQAGVKHGRILQYQIREALCDFRVYYLLMQQFAIGMINSALRGYCSALLRGLGWLSLQTARHRLPSGAVQLLAICIAGYLASRFRNITTVIYFGRRLLGGDFAGPLVSTRTKRRGIILPPWYWVLSLAEVGS
jgi:hypothetical protein